MYANRVSVAASEKEGYIRFECITPKLIDKVPVSEFNVIENCDIIMSRDMMKEVVALIENVLKEDQSPES